jgi:monoamine oxidase
LFFAGEACSPKNFTTAHGAYESGVAAADQVITGLKLRVEDGQR